MRICIFGSGGVGGYFGGRLAEAGEDVYFVSRGAHYEAMRENGLAVTSIFGDFHLDPVNVVLLPQQAAPFDIVLVAVKAWQVTEAAEAIKGTLAEGGAAIPLLNGVEASAQLADILGPESVVEGLCGVVAYIEKPGHIRHIGVEPFIQIGERDGTASSRTANIAELLSRANGMKASVPENMRVALWLKFLFIVAMSGVGAVSRAPIGVTRSLQSTRALLVGCVSEAAAVGRALGVPLPDNAVDAVMNSIDNVPEQATASMQRDIAAGKPSELATQNAAVVRLGYENKIPTPINEFISSALMPLEQRARGELFFE
jgi:2-dehydropantoate 2-reductase